MRARLFLVLALATIGLAAGLGPAQGSSVYHMNGQGTLTISGGGLPACLPAAGVPDCADANVAFDWGNLTVQGLGVLQDQNVAGQYACASTGSGFESRIFGNTSNFQLTFNFVCTNATGVGPAFINGWFSSCTSCPANAAYHSVTAHSLNAGGQLAHPGAPVFFGYFKAGATSTAPYAINASNGDAMTCLGGFAPSAVNGTRITTAAFIGECNAAEA